MAAKLVKAAKALLRENVSKKSKDRIVVGISLHILGLREEKKKINILDGGT